MNPDTQTDKRKTNNGFQSSYIYADSHAISRFFTTGQRFEILSVKTAKRAILTYYQAPLDIKQQYLKSKHFIDVIENSSLFDFQITTW